MLNFFGLNDQVSFHQHFTWAFLVWKCFLQLFSNYSLALWLFGKRISAKTACKMLMKLIPKLLADICVMSSITSVPYPKSKDCSNHHVKHTNHLRRGSRNAKIVNSAKDWNMRRPYRGTLHLKLILLRERKLVGRKNNFENFSLRIGFRALVYFSGTKIYSAKFW